MGGICTSICKLEQVCTYEGMSMMRHDEVVDACRERP
jgi:hypothetical protein